MSLVLPASRPLPTRPLALLALTVGLTFASALGLAPTLARAAAAATHAATCHCAHCPGGAKCCCRPGGPRLACPSS